MPTFIYRIGQSFAAFPLQNLDLGKKSNTIEQNSVNIIQSGQVLNPSSQNSLSANPKLSIVIPGATLLFSEPANINAHPAQSEIFASMLPALPPRHGLSQCFSYLDNYHVQFDDYIENVLPLILETKLKMKDYGFSFAVVGCGFGEELATVAALTLMCIKKNKKKGWLAIDDFEFMALEWDEDVLKEAVERLNGRSKFLVEKEFMEGGEWEFYRTDYSKRVEEIIYTLNININLIERCLTFFMGDINDEEVIKYLAKYDVIFMNNIFRQKNDISANVKRIGELFAKYCEKSFILGNCENESPITHINSHILVPGRKSNTLFGQIIETPYLIAAPPKYFSHLIDH